MNVGDLVRLKIKSPISQKYWDAPLGIVVEEMHSENEFHHRVRVMWIGEEIPVAARAFSVNSAKVTTWISPKHFTVVSEVR